MVSQQPGPSSPEGVAWVENAGFGAALLALCLGCGSPSGPASGAGTPDGSTVLVPPTSELVFSEIMYHPVRENSAEDEHEFVELHNSGTRAVSVAGWKLHSDKSDRLVIPQGTTIAAGGYLVLAKRRDRLLADTRYQLSRDAVIGDFTGELDNGGGKVSILDQNGTLKDSVDYDDDAPWPMGADAFGAQEEWLPGLGPYDNHQYMGRSLERYSAVLPSSDPRNWEASAVDQATPGRANGVSGEPPAIVLSVSALSESAQSPAISANDTVRVTAKLSAGSVTDVAVEYRLDPVEKIGTSTAILPMSQKPGTETTYQATLPKTAENTVVRYRILAARSGAERERIGPRTTDPREFYAYFVAPRLASGRSYHLFITPQNWSTLGSNLHRGLSDGCVIHPTWDATVPAVFVDHGRVYDVQVRYQGSRYRRTDSMENSSWTAPGYGQRVYSWRVKFPRYDRFEGFAAINLNKQKQACPGVLNALEAELLKAAGIPAEEYRFARFYINGGYYSYAMEVRDTEEQVLAAFEGPEASAGDLFESDGVSRGDSDGPWGLGDFTPLLSVCNLTPQQRYQLTYERHSHRWKDETADGHAELISLIDQLDLLTASASGSAPDPRVVAYFEKNFDVSRLISHYAVRNWTGVWDDGTHNYQPYKRSTDGKWMVLSHDFDCNFGGNSACGATQDATLSFYHPETGRGRTWTGPSRLKVELIRSFRTEFAARVNQLGKTLFTENSVNQTLDRVLAGFDRTAWLEAPARACDLDARVSAAKQWLAERRSFWARGVQ